MTGSLSVSGDYGTTERRTTVPLVLIDCTAVRLVLDDGVLSELELHCLCPSARRVPISLHHGTSVPRTNPSPSSRLREVSTVRIPVVFGHSGVFKGDFRLGEPGRYVLRGGSRVKE